ncbi:hypothetical protein SAMN05216404_11359 [Nitrosospira multiformis]|uniref:TraJ protein n=1 Tax=Nitrosospira multiformis TaxID=1231 RepID=A0A1H8MPG0_9PROT|nr:conjugal transfer transcriptional regulator TraJ [Nitrosospira multiformis]SEO19138.1 hypothetical protein SAMN05216404_11359 [Nitrosospira multiformis]
MGLPASGHSPFTFPFIRTDVLNRNLALRGKLIGVRLPPPTGESMEQEQEPTRKGSTPIKVYCLPEEKAQIAENAKAAGLSLSTFLLRVGAGFEVRTVLDYQRIEELARVNGDLGRLGGLLKLWLTNDERLREVRTEELRGLLNKIERNQEAMRTIMQKVLAR